MILVKMISITIFGLFMLSACSEGVLTMRSNLDSAGDLDLTKAPPIVPAHPGGGVGPQDPESEKKKKIAAQYLVIMEKNKGEK